MSDYVWLNDALIRTEDAHIAPTDRGFLLADGLFETLRVTRGSLPHFDLHMQRFTNGCQTLRLPIPDLLFLRRACACVLESNQHLEGSLRITFTRGPGPRGLAPPSILHPTLLITSAPRPQTSPTEITVQVSRYTRPPCSPLSAVKSLSYLPAIMARTEAQEAGYDDALMRCPYGQHLASGTASTLVIAQDNKLYTPPIHSGALPGTSRARIIKSGICEEKDITIQNYNNFTSAHLITCLNIININQINFTNNDKIKQIIYDILFDL
ncbi:aminotransferase class IV [Neokomagataea anthophila]|uniref:Probable branched-chain-amino-acid aminotransferase n=1 Tax=Neokomagataea anthophila TaxID=2826925 RepID=A0ABS5E7J3_9PROT|nr:aminotransferase class IV [Neokomagataea anthophila]MBR0559849.1 aminotransferase class IV [Neokomagataea anthophila]